MRRFSKAEKWIVWSPQSAIRISHFHVAFQPDFKNKYVFQMFHELHVKQLLRPPTLSSKTSMVQLIKTYLISFDLIMFFIFSQYKPIIGRIFDVSWKLAGQEGPISIQYHSQSIKLGQQYKPLHCTNIWPLVEIGNQ